MKYRIREVAGEERSYVVDIDRKLFQKRSPQDSPGPDITTGHWWIVEDETKAIVGYAGMVPNSGDPAQVYLCRSGVLREHRGNGLQKRLIKKRLDKARQLGFTEAVSDTFSNPWSGNSLISCGFRLFRPEYPWSYKGACYWKRQL